VKKNPYELLMEGLPKALNELLRFRLENKPPPTRLVLSIMRAIAFYDVVDDRGQRITEFGREITGSRVAMVRLILVNREIVDQILFADRNGNYLSNLVGIHVGDDQLSKESDARAQLLHAR
jgi:hypothetical protein